MPISALIIPTPLVTFSCIGILYEGLHEWPINAEFPVITLLFVE
jgi:hypothetical protein